MVRAQVGFRCLAVRQAARRSWRSSSRAAEACRDNRTAQPRGGERRAENYTSLTIHVVVGRKDMPPPESSAGSGSETGRAGGARPRRRGLKESGSKFRRDGRRKLDVCARRKSTGGGGGRARAAGFGRSPYDDGGEVHVHNDLGIYLHDTPWPSLLAAQRALSAGAVRWEDAPSDNGLQVETVQKRADSSAEQPVDLSEPVLLYLLYLTAAPPLCGGLILGPDRYGWDGL